MKNRLSIFGGFAHDPQGILTTIGQLAFVSIERGFNFLLGISFELRVATLAYGEERRGLFYDLQLALWHDPSLAQGGDVA
jgi:hypothetical protein